MKKINGLMVFLSLGHFTLFSEYFISTTIIYVLVVSLLITYSAYGLILQKAVSECVFLILVMACYLVLNDDLLTLNFVGSNNFIINDYLSYITKILICFFSAIYFLIISNVLKEQKLTSFEYLLVILFAILGLLLMCSSNDFLIIYLSIELSSLSLYILASFKKNSSYSIESGLKYFVTGALSSAFFLLGSSFIYLHFGSIYCDDFFFFLEKIKGDLINTIFFFNTIQVDLYQDLLSKSFIYSYKKLFELFKDFIKLKSISEHDHDKIICNFSEFSTINYLFNLRHFVDITKWLMEVKDHTHISLKSYLTYEKLYFFKRLLTVSEKNFFMHLINSSELTTLDVFMNLLYCYEYLIIPEVPKDQSCIICHFSPYSKPNTDFLNKLLDTNDLTTFELWNRSYNNSWRMLLSESQQLQYIKSMEDYDAYASNLNLELIKTVAAYAIYVLEREQDIVKHCFDMQVSAYNTPVFLVTQISLVQTQLEVLLNKYSDWTLDKWLSSLLFIKDEKLLDHFKETIFKYYTKLESIVIDRFCQMYYHSIPKSLSRLDHLSHKGVPAYSSDEWTEVLVKLDEIYFSNESIILHEIQYELIEELSIMSPKNKSLIQKFSLILFQSSFGHNTPLSVYKIKQILSNNEYYWISYFYILIEYTYLQNPSAENMLYKQPTNQLKHDLIKYYNTIPLKELVNTVSLLEKNAIYFFENIEIKSFSETNIYNYLAYYLLVLMQDIFEQDVQFSKLISQIENPDTSFIQTLKACYKLNKIYTKKILNCYSSDDIILYFLNKDEKELKNFVLMLFKKRYGCLPLNLNDLYCISTKDFIKWYESQNCNKKQIFLKCSSIMILLHKTFFFSVESKFQCLKTIKKHLNCFDVDELISLNLYFESYFKTKISSAAKLVQLELNLNDKKLSRHEYIAEELLKPHDKYICYKLSKLMKNHDLFNKSSFFNIHNRIYVDYIKELIVNRPVYPTKELPIHDKYICYKIIKLMKNHDLFNKSSFFNIHNRIYVDYIKELIVNRPVYPTKELPIHDKYICYKISKFMKNHDLFNKSSFFNIHNRIYVDYIKELIVSRPVYPTKELPIHDKYKCYKISKLIKNLDPSFFNIHNRIYVDYIKELIVNRPVYPTKELPIHDKYKCYKIGKLIKNLDPSFFNIHNKIYVDYIKELIVNRPVYPTKELPIHDKYICYKIIKLMKSHDLFNKSSFFNIHNRIYVDYIKELIVNRPVYPTKELPIHDKYICYKIIKLMKSHDLFNKSSFFNIHNRIYVDYDYMKELIVNRPVYPTKELPINDKYICYKIIKLMKSHDLFNKSSFFNIHNRIYVDYDYMKELIVNRPVYPTKELPIHDKYICYKISKLIKNLDPSFFNIHNRIYVDYTKELIVNRPVYPTKELPINDKYICYKIIKLMKSHDLFNKSSFFNIHNRIYVDYDYMKELIVNRPVYPTKELPIHDKYICYKISKLIKNLDPSFFNIHNRIYVDYTKELIVNRPVYPTKELPINDKYICYKIIKLMKSHDLFNKSSFFNIHNRIYVDYDYMKELIVNRPVYPTKELPIHDKYICYKISKLIKNLDPSFFNIHNRIYVDYDYMKELIVNRPVYPTKELPIHDKYICYKIIKLMKSHDLFNKSSFFNIHNRIYVDYDYMKELIVNRPVYPTKELPIHDKYICYKISKFMKNHDLFNKSSFFNIHNIIYADFIRELKLTQPNILNMYKKNLLKYLYTFVLLDIQKSNFFNIIELDKIINIIFYEQINERYKWNHLQICLILNSITLQDVKNIASNIIVYNWYEFAHIFRYNIYLNSNIYYSLMEKEFLYTFSLSDFLHLETQDLCYYFNYKANFIYFKIDPFCCFSNFKAETVYRMDTWVKIFNESEIVFQYCDNILNDHYNNEIIRLNTQKKIISLWTTQWIVY